MIQQIAVIVMACIGVICIKLYHDYMEEQELFKEFIRDAQKSMAQKRKRKWTH